MNASEYLVAAGLGLLIGIALSIGLGYVLLASRISRISKNVKDSHELLESCKEKQLELNRIIALMGSKILNLTEEAKILDWDPEKYPNLEALPDGKILIARTEDLKAVVKTT